MYVMYVVKIGFVDFYAIRATASKLCVISNGCFESTMIYVGEIL